MRIYFLFLLSLPIAMIYAQSSVYYPLARGNQWDFTNSGGPILQPNYSIVITGDTLMPNGYKYAIKMKETVTGIISLYSYERFSNDTVYLYSKSIDEPVWYFFVKDSVFIDSYNNQLKLAMDTLSFYGHRFKRWNKETRNSTGTTNGIYYADSIGFIEQYNINLQFVDINTLTAAKIDSVKYGNPRQITLGISDNLMTKNTEYKLYQNYPNPFNPTTWISYSIPKKSYVELTVIDILGRIVSVLVSKEQDTGEYKVLFDGSAFPSGVYMYNIHAGDFRASKKILLLK